MIKNELHIKDFLKAKRPVDLQKLMLENSIKTRSYHDYNIIFAEGFWYAWFEVDGSNLIEKEYDAINKSKG
jgi:hypothetical protein